MFQKIPVEPVDGFKWVEEDDLSELNEHFIKNYDENIDKEYHKISISSIVNYQFYPKE